MEVAMIFPLNMKHENGFASRSSPEFWSIDVSAVSALELRAAAGRALRRCS